MAVIDYNDERLPTSSVQSAGRTRSTPALGTPDHVLTLQPQIYNGCPYRTTSIGDTSEKSFWIQKQETLFGGTLSQLLQ